MANVHDIARYLLMRQSMSTMKLQKLVYYAQAWNLARRGRPLFDAPIEAWANGPVVRGLYETHRGQYHVTGWPAGDVARLTHAERELLDEMLDTYGQCDAQWLSRLTHAEQPWKQARGALPDNARSNARISQQVMRNFYREELRRHRTPSAVTARA